LAFHARCVRLALRLLAKGEAAWPRAEAVRMLVGPMDSVRYFEFDFAWEALTAGGPPRRYLDVASPRLLPSLLVDAFPGVRADFLNPDVADLATTRRLVTAQGNAGRVAFHDALVADAALTPGAFDAVSCISVLEHIPDDVGALRAMWALLAPGGRFVLTVPCAAAGYVEHVDLNEYGLLRADSDGFVFGQRFYDEAQLAERVTGVIGSPARTAVFGERRPGAFAANRAHKLRDPTYPIHREPYFVGREFAPFPRVADLPGVGVVAMHFVKS
jgi:SAM-dependent methyltransferase